MRIGIDLGGTKIEIIALDDERQEIYRKRVATPQGCYSKTLAALVELVAKAEGKIGVVNCSVGIGIPGSISNKTGKIKNANSTWLIGEDLKGDLEQKLNRPIRLANDADCFALSESSDGAGKDYDSVFGVIVGTGCGGGLVVNKQALSGVNGIVGEWGHNPLPWQAEDDASLPCYCGLSACNETFLSGTGFANHYALNNNQQLTAIQIVSLAEQGDEFAKRALESYCIWLAKGLASVMNVFDPDVIVLGGGMSNVAQLYQRVPQLWDKWVFSDQVETKLLAPKWSDSSGVRGAAWLWSY